MTWIDFFVVLGFILFIWSGHSRGVVMECFEFMIVTFNVLLCTHIYHFMSDLFVTFIHTPSLVASIISYVFFFVLFSVVVWILAGKAEMAINFPPSFGANRFGGAFFAFLKGWLIIWTVFFLIAQIPDNEDTRQVLHNSPTVQAVQSITPIIDSTLALAGSQKAYRTMHPLIERSTF